MERRDGRRIAWLLAAVAGLLLTVAGPALATEGGEGVQGTLESAEGEPVEGVEIIVTTPDGGEVGTAQTDADGSFDVPLPGPGEYQVGVTVETLPEGSDLRNPERNPLTVNVRSGRSLTVQFPIGERTGPLQQTGAVERVAQTLIDGVKFGLIIAMTAIGLSLIFGTTGLTNFAHGELVAAGAVIAWFLNANPPAGLGIQLIPAAALAVVAGGGLGLGLERGLFQPLRNRRTNLITLLVVTIGLSLALRQVLLFIFGGVARPYSDYTIQRALDLGPVTQTPKDLTVMVLSVLVLVGVGVFLLRTRIGKAIRAVADNRDLAASSGIDVQRVILFVWGLGGALAALGGVFQGVVESVNWNMGFQLLLLMFAGVTLGGLGTAFGALAGSLVIGIITQLSTLYLPPELKSVLALAALVLVLLVRPQGILGQSQRIG
jgi:branched-chain amino acid transport system permease protein